MMMLRVCTVARKSVMNMMPMVSNIRFASTSATEDNLRNAAQDRSDAIVNLTRQGLNPSAAAASAEHYIGNVDDTTTDEKVTTYKRSTFLAGVPVDPNGRENLIKICDEVIAAAQDRLPENTPYRNHIEQNYGYMRAVALQNEDIYTIEQEIECGQIETIIDGGKDELDLVNHYANEKLWEHAQEFDAYMKDPNNFERMEEMMYPHAAPGDKP